MKTENVDIDSISQDPANVRLHPERNLETIKASLRRFKQQKPIVVDADGIVRAGNGTLEAARALGWKTIAVVRTPLKGSEATAYAIADNRTAELAAWDQTGLAEQLRSLQSEDFDLDAVGYTDDEVGAIIDGLAAELAGDAEAATDAPEAQVDRADELLKKWSVEPGDLWAIPSLTTPGAEHRLICGDCTDREAVGRLMAGKRADLCFTSPPYNLGTSTGGGFPKAGGMWSTSGLERGYKTYSDAMPQEDYFAWQAAFLTSTWEDVLSDDGAIFYNHRPRVQAGVLITPLSWNPGLPVRQIVVWNSGAGINFAPTHYRPSCEWVVIFAKPEFRLKSKGDSGCGDVWDIPAAMRIDGHPAPFPVELPRRAIETVGPRLVYEPYSGSGTTLCASEQCGVPCFGVELSAAYVAVALERLSEMGLSPNLQNGG